MSSLPIWSVWLAVPILAALFWLGFRWIFSLDDDPRRRPGVVYIDLRPLAGFVEVLFYGTGSFMVLAGLDTYTDDLGKGIGLATFGLVFALITGFASNTHLWLDDQGVSYRSGVGKIQFISWGRLDHYEVHIKSGGGQGGSTLYYEFRSNDGVTISVSRSSYDVGALLEKIRSHKDIREEAYKRQGLFSS